MSTHYALSAERSPVPAAGLSQGHCMCPQIWLQHPPTDMPRRIVLPSQTVWSLSHALSPPAPRVMEQRLCQPIWSVPLSHAAQQKKKPAPHLFGRHATCSRCQSFPQRGSHIGAEICQLHCRACEHTFDVGHWILPCSLTMYMEPSIQKCGKAKLSAGQMSIISVITVLVCTQAAHLPRLLPTVGCSWHSGNSSGFRSP